ncbi:MAG: hypothetical protein ACLQSR_13165 [Limisphaerales bacterium]
MIKKPTAPNPAKAKIPFFLKVAALLVIVLCALFYQNFEHGMVLFSNDGPLGGLVSTMDRMPTILMGYWQNLNSIGSNSGSDTLDVTTTIKLFWECLFSGFTGPLGFANSYVPIALFIMSIGAWAFFHKLKLSPLASTLGALAVMLNVNLFSGACWGVASDQIALGFNFLALALVTANDDEPSPLIFWTRIALAGLCVGVNVMEAADVGALCSLFVALYILFKSVVENDSPAAVKIGRGLGRVAVVAVFAGFIATQTVVSLVGTQIQGISGTAQDEQTKLARWDFATQWSLPKRETLGILVPGLFGYRMDTPLNTMPLVQDRYGGGGAVYWGGVGREPSIDRYFASGGKDSPPGGIMRFGYGGYYCGILVALVAFWTIAQSFRREKSAFTVVQRKFIWFWGVIIFLSLLLAWGRFAPIFYGFLYLHVPYFSTMRNPGKFLLFITWGLTVLFAYGVHGLDQRFLSVQPPAKDKTQEEDKFDQRWLWVVGGLFAVSAIAWLIYAAGKNGLVQYLKYRGFPDDKTAQAIASFSISQAAWFLLIFAVAIILLTVIIKGYCAGRWAKLGAWLLGVFLVFDLARADLPFIIHWNYFQKYEVGTLNPVVDFLRQKPYEHRVAILPQPPFNFPAEYQVLPGIYGIEWSQHLFPYYDIESLDKIQMPREPVDLMAFEQAFLPQTEGEMYYFAREWQLTNTRYLLGPAAAVDVLNAQFDPQQQRFRIEQRFGITLKPGFLEYDGDSSELTAVADTNGPFALIDFTGALPRAKLYADWQTNSTAELNNFTTNLDAADTIIFGNAGTNGLLILKKLESPSFDPQKTVLLDAPVAGATPDATVQDAGTVEFQSYAPKKILLDVDARVPAVLLLNDKYDPNWHVSIDGQPTALFHANFIMQGVFVPAGKHTVEYQFYMPSKPFYVTVVAIFAGLILCGILVFHRPAPKPSAPRRF